MYKNSFVAAIKVNGKILREQIDKVFLPFNSEYSIILKNLDKSRRAEVYIKIDSKDVLNGSLIMHPDSEIELERFVESLDSGYKFKFIERTEKIENHRGITLSDGLIEISFAHEISYPRYNQFPKITVNEPVDFWKPGHEVLSYPGVFHPSALSSTCFNNAVSSNCVYRGSIGGSLSGSTNATPLGNNIGITTQGSESNQQFSKAAPLGLCTSMETIIFNLFGDVSRPLEVKTKIECPMCKTKNKSKNKYCVECGTNLSAVSKVDNAPK